MQFMRPPSSTAPLTASSSATAAAAAAAAAPPAPAPALPPERAIIHLDMDCFFAAASVVDYPVLRGKPLVVCHSSSAQGTGEVCGLGGASHGERGRRNAKHGQKAKGAGHLGKQCRAQGRGRAELGRGGRRVGGTRCRIDIGLGTLLVWWRCCMAPSALFHADPDQLKPAVCRAALRGAL